MVNYLLDTCVLSELFKEQPAPPVTEWIETVDEARLFVSVLYIGELEKGVARLEEGRKKLAIQTWLHQQLLPRFGSRLLPLDQESMVIWGGMCGAAEGAGRPLPFMDSLLAATALRWNLVVVTRNTRDFGAMPVETFDPWQTATPAFGRLPVDRRGAGRRLQEGERRQGGQGMAPHELSRRVLSRGAEGGRCGSAAGDGVEGHWPGQGVRVWAAQFGAGIARGLQSGS